ncbi:hypothetical protein BJ973_005223 [Actinoplanes tereljensis]|uniref:Bacterial CdiA-CT RNAse A domain-containing protein n=1 Tax=Paractinoplanes tereljensis TaxID=571912 RepID=A0A919NNU8_9ACTN|nr:hypothetical protein [Actinoplanes tereljensis]GIF21329.1 hypothetical protein Ate02nite_40590 [Actinoplanes tereljensis]
MPRSRPHDSGTDPPGSVGQRRPHRSGGDSGSVAEAHDRVLAALKRGRIGESHQTTSGTAETTAPPRPQTPDDLELSAWEDEYAKFGDEPPKFNLAANDQAHQGHNAHTLDNHGPDALLRRDPSQQTIEGRIHNDTGWGKAANGSFKWIDHTTMHRAINKYVRENWEQIRNNLAIDGEHSDVFSAGHAIGEGFVNKGMYGAGPREAQYSVTSTVRILIRVAPGTDPPEPFILTTFPSGLG